MGTSDRSHVVVGGAGGGEVSRSRTRTASQKRTVSAVRFLMGCSDFVLLKLSFPHSPQAFKKLLVSFHQCFVPYFNGCHGRCIVRIDNIQNNACFRVNMNTGWVFNF